MYMKKTSQSKLQSSILLLLLALFFSTKGQQNPGLALYNFHTSYLNPAAVGFNGESSFQLHYRNQWSQYQSTYDGSGNLGTQIASLSVGFDELNLGGGLQYVNDLTPSGAGLQFVKTQFAYHLPVGEGTLSFGTQLGIASKSFDGRAFRYRDPNDPTISEISGKTIAKSAFDVGFGLIYNRDKWNVGLSVDHLNSPSFAFSNAVEQVQMKPMITLHGALKLPISEQIVINPFTQVRVYQGNLLVDLGTRVQFGRFIWVGGNMRTNDALAGMFGVNALKNKLEFGYALEQTIANQSIKAPLSHEVFVKFNLPSFGIKSGGSSVAPINTPRFKIN